MLMQRVQGTYLPSKHGSQNGLFFKGHMSLLRPSWASMFAAELELTERTIIASSNSNINKNFNNNEASSNNSNSNSNSNRSIHSFS